MENQNTTTNTTNVPNGNTPQPITPINSLPPEKNIGNNTRETIKNILSTIGVFLLAPIIAILLTLFVFQSYEVDGPSMEETLQNQDRLIVYKLPKTWAVLTKKAYIPKRGEIIVFTRHESNSSGEESRHLIKRVIGVPGDNVVIRDGAVTVFNEDSPDGIKPDENQDYAKHFKKTTGNIDVTVDENEVFVLGDNRDNSLDSRVFGVVKSSDITGELILRLYPFNKFESF